MARWTRRPPLGTRIDPGHPLAQGLVFLAPLAEGGGSYLWDGASGLSLPIAGGAAWAGARAWGLSCASATARAQVTCPAWLQLPGPATIAVAYRYLGDAGTNSVYFGTSYTGANTTPFSSLQLGWHNATDKAPALFWNNGTTVQSLFGTTAHVVGRDYVSIATLAPGAQALYLNGIAQGSAAVAGSIAYGASPQLALGANTAFGRNPNALIYWGALWDVLLAPAQIAELGADPEAIFSVFLPEEDPMVIYPVAALFAHNLALLGCGR